MDLTAHLLRRAIDIGVRSLNDRRASVRSIVFIAQNWEQQL